MLTICFQTAPTPISVERASYMAVAVIQHLGEELNSGHNVAVVRQTAHPRPDWWICNDGVVSTTSWTTVTMDAVAVLYRRVPSPSS